MHFFICFTDLNCSPLKMVCSSRGPLVCQGGVQGKKNIKNKWSSQMVASGAFSTAALSQKSIIPSVM